MPADPLKPSPSPSYLLALAGCWSISLHLLIGLGMALHPTVWVPHSIPTPLEIHLQPKAKPGLQKEVFAAAPTQPIAPAVVTPPKEKPAQQHVLIASTLPAWEGGLPEWLTTDSGQVNTRQYVEADAIVEPDFQLPPRDADAPPLIELDVSISERGEVENVEVISSVLEGRQTAAIVRQVYRTLFTPAREDGRPVPSVKRLTDPPRE
ncbi:hypothetical protein YWS52_07630 [Chitiniphilus shinanonensis]